METLSGEDFPSQRLSVLFPLFVLSLKLALTCGPEDWQVWDLRRGVVTTTCFIGSWHESLEVDVDWASSRALCRSDSQELTGNQHPKKNKRMNTAKPWHSKTTSLRSRDQRWPPGKKGENSSQ